MSLCVLCGPCLQITLWGPPSAPQLHDYSYRLWGGLLSSFYAERWQQWTSGVTLAMTAVQPFDEAQFLVNITAWELAWTQHIAANLTTNATGNAVELSTHIYDTYFTKPVQ